MSSSFKIEFADSSDGGFENNSYDEDSDQETEEVSRSEGGENDHLPTMMLARGGEGKTRPSELQSHQHASLFYISLIESQCRMQAVKSINRGRRPADLVDEDDPEVQELARHLFSEMSKELSKAGVLPASEFASSELAGLRASYLSSFHSMLENISSGHDRGISSKTSFGPLTVRQHEFQGDLAYLQPSNTFAMPRHSLNPRQLQILSSSLSEQRAMVDSRAFKHEYEKIRCIGKGGFGQVFECRNHIDKQVYAIKQIVLSRHKSGKTMKPEKVHAILSEAQTLARLNHPNIVRYYHTWAEECVSAAPSPQPSQLLLTQGDDDKAYHSLADLWSSIPVITVDDETSCVVEFVDDENGSENDEKEEQSENIASLNSAVNKDLTETSNDQEVGTQRNESNGKGKFWASFHSSLTEDTDTEENPSKANRVYYGDVVLFIKMSLYPLTLDRYLSSDAPQADGLQHCFHVSQAVGIMGGILDGVEYLHSQRIIHRDLKPANIFLSITSDRTSAGDGSFAITSCSGCNLSGAKQRKMFLTPCIGDFGLIAEMEQPDTAESESSSSAQASHQLTRAASVNPAPVGTQFYRPAKMPTESPIICPKLDIFSLGVITFEMIYKFNTKSERIRVLDALSKKADFPSDFTNHEMSSGIRCMIEPERDKRWDLQKVRNWITGLKSYSKMDSERTS